MIPVGLRSVGRSAIQPPASFAKLESPSETPSITPSANAGAARLARNAGRIAVAASWPQSENKLARPMPSTPRVSQSFGGDIGAGRDAGEEAFMVRVSPVSAPPLRQPRAAADGARKAAAASKRRSAQTRGSGGSSHKTGARKLLNGAEAS